ncbi:MAG: choice-of-anchor H family protein [Colwellia sp.]
MKTKLTINNFLSSTLLIVITTLCNSQVIANEVNQNKNTISYGTVKKLLTDEQRQAIITNNQFSKTSDQMLGKATGLTREAVIQSKKSLIKKAKALSLVQEKYGAYSTDFSIYSATRTLQEDYDGDGYYQTFAVTFDADLYYADQTAIVYALLYISEDGGPWTHYYTTNNFVIEGNSNLDEYEVMTTFLTGYHPNQYDILIDLYEVDYNEIMATYSADDTNTLYALPLESADYNEPYVEEVDVILGGGFSLLSLLMMLPIFYWRTKVQPT